MSERKADIKSKNGKQGFGPCATCGKATPHFWGVFAGDWVCEVCLMPEAGS